MYLWTGRGGSLNWSRWGTPRGSSRDAGRKVVGNMNLGYKHRTGMVGDGWEGKRERINEGDDDGGKREEGERGGANY